MNRNDNEANDTVPNDTVAAASPRSFAMPGESVLLETVFAAPISRSEIDAGQNELKT